MLKAVLQYTDCSKDNNIFYQILSSRNIEILNSKKIEWRIDYNVTIRVKDYIELNKLVLDLNKNCRYGVKVIQVKKDHIFNIMSPIKSWNNYILFNRRKGG